MYRVSVPRFAGTSRLTFDSAYQLLSEARGLAKEYQYLRVRIKTEQCRLLDWATVTELTESENTLSIDRYSKNMVVDVLDQQRQLLLKFGRLDSRLQPLANPVITEERTNGEESADARHRAHAEETLDSRFPDASELLAKCVKYVRNTNKFPGQLRWAISDKKATEELLKKLSELNDYLCELLNSTLR